MAFITFAIAMIGYGIAKGYRYFIKCQRDSLLQPPIDLTNSEEENSNIQERKQNNARYTKFQARQRFKKGKM